MSWLHHPSGKIAVWVEDPVMVQDNNKVSKDKPEKGTKKK